jgi:hypothetical protein
LSAFPARELAEPRFIFHAQQVGIEELRHAEYHEQRSNNSLICDGHHSGGQNLAYTPYSISVTARTGRQSVVIAATMRRARRSSQRLLFDHRILLKLGP